MNTRELRALTQESESYSILPWGFTRPGEEEWHPQLDLYETDTAFILEADLPGVKEQEVSVEIEGNDLVLHGQRAFERVTLPKLPRERESAR